MTDIEKLKQLLVLVKWWRDTYCVNDRDSDGRLPDDDVAKEMIRYVSSDIKTELNN